MRQWSRFLVLLAFLLPYLRSTASADEARLRCTADTSVSSYSGEADSNYGQSSRLRLKGIQMIALFQFDTAPIKGWKIDSAKLYLRYASAERKLRTLGLSTISAPWTEGTGSGEKKSGETCFAWREQGNARWAGRDTDFTDVSYTAGNTLAAYANIEDKADGWFAVSVDPRIVNAMAAGLSYGMAVSDEKGQTSANNDVYSREQNNSQPYLVVTGHAEALPVPASIIGLNASPDPRHAAFDMGAAKLIFSSPPGALGYRIKYRGTALISEVQLPRHAVPYAISGMQQTVTLMGLPPGGIPTSSVSVTAINAQGIAGPETSTAVIFSSTKFKPAPLTARALPGANIQEPRPGATGLRIWAYPDTEKAHPISGNLLEEAGAGAYAGATVGTYRRGNPVWDGKAVRLFAARDEIVAFNLLVESAAGGTQGITLRTPESLAGSAGAIRPTVSVFREWYVRDGEWFPEACVPLTVDFDIPAADNHVTGQKNQSILVELLVPADAKPGLYIGEIGVTANGKIDRVPLRLEVNSLILPNTLSFDISLNTYGTVGGPFGIDDRTPEYRALERDYHRLAHAHRSTLAPLGYSHSGRVSSNYAPPLMGDGAQMRISDWSSWDAQFGPYLDGSAFKGLPRDGVPITHLYTPFHEAWPADINKHYRYTPTIRDYPATITEHALNAPPIEEAMDRPFAEAFTSVVRQWARHMHEKGWTKTQLQLYQNDKNYYKDPKMGGHGTSWWLLDEPNFRDDWLALAYFARLFRQGMKDYPDVPMVHREDVSRPQWQRDYLDYLVDLMVVSGEIYTKGPRLREMREKVGMRYWNYGEANPVKQTNLTAEAWAVRAWLAGADAIVPWQSVGEDANYEKADPTALILPGKRFGIIGPIATLRLKALRRAQQDVEYLIQLAAKRGWDREQAAAAIAGLLKLQGALEKNSDDDAGRYRFGALHEADFDALRRAVADATTVR